MNIVDALRHDYSDPIKALNVIRAKGNKDATVDILGTGNSPK
jgi:hypothetical protein